MNIKSIQIAAALLALTASAADVSYTYTAGVTNPGEGVTIAYDGDGNIMSLTAVPTGGGTITLTGGTPTFASGATITVNAAGTLAFGGKVTSLGALTINRGDNAYLVWSSDAPLPIDPPGALAFAGVSNADIELVKLVSTGADNDSDVCGQQGLWTCLWGPDNSGFYLFNKETAAHVFSARLQLTEQDGNLYARCRTGIRSPRFGLYPDEEAGWATRNLFADWAYHAAYSERGLYSYGDNPSAGTYEASQMGGVFLGLPTKLGFSKLIARRTNVPGGAMSVRFAGGAALGGATTIGAGLEAVVVATSSNTATLGHAITGDGDFKIEAASSGSVATLTCDMSGLKGGAFTVEGTAAAAATVTANAGTRFPYGGEVHVNNNGTLRLVGSENSWKSSLFAHRGGTLQMAGASIHNRQLVVLDGGKYECASYGSYYLNYLTVSNATVNGSASFRSAYNYGNAQFQYWRVIGTEPSTITPLYGVLVYGANTAANARANACAFRMDVADVTTEGDGVDCTLKQINCDSGSYKWFWFEKYGAGTLKLTANSKAVQMASKLYNGTLLLAGSGIMTNAVELLGGNLASAAGCGNELGNLTAATNATLTVGLAGRLSFASFTPGTGLAPKAIIIDTPLVKGWSYIRIGKDANGLAQAHRQYFRFRDPTDPTVLYRVYQDSAGYLYPLPPQGMVMRIK